MDDNKPTSAPTPTLAPTPTPTERQREQGRMRQEEGRMRQIARRERQEEMKDERRRQRKEGQSKQKEKGLMRKEDARMRQLAQQEALARANPITHGPNAFGYLVPQPPAHQPGQPLNGVYVGQPIAPEEQPLHSEYEGIAELVLQEQGRAESGQGEAEIKGYSQYLH